MTRMAIISNKAIINFNCFQAEKAFYRENLMRTNKTYFPLRTLSNNIHKMYKSQLTLCLLRYCGKWKREDLLLIGCTSIMLNYVIYKIGFHLLLNILCFSILIRVIKVKAV